MLEIPSSEHVKQYVKESGNDMQKKLVDIIARRVPRDVTKDVINDVIRKIPLDDEDVVVKCVTKPLPDNLKVMMETRQNDLLPWDHDVTECSATGLPFNEISMYLNVYDTASESVIY